MSRRVLTQVHYQSIICASNEKIIKFELSFNIDTVTLLSLFLHNV